MAKYIQAFAQEPQLHDYEFVNVLGKGAYSEVVLAKNKVNGHESAMKVIDKNFLEMEKKTHHVFIEKEVLSTLRHPGIIKLFNAFDSKDKLFLSVELLTDGNLLDYLNKTHLSDKQIRFYAAELLTIMEHLHQFGIVHRDIKPENILLTKDKHLKLIDFATAMVFDETKMPNGAKILAIRNLYHRPKASSTDNNEVPEIKYCRKSSFVGTSDYLSPELIDYSLCGPQSDLWALGCFIYQLYTSQLPFQADNEYMLFQKILKEDPAYGIAIPQDAVELMKILLAKSPQQRFHSDNESFDYRNLKQMPFFAGIDFTGMWNQNVPKPVIVPTNVKRRQSRFISTMVGGPPPTEQQQIQIRGASNLRQKEDKIVMKGIVDKEHGILFFAEFSPRSMSLVIHNGAPYLIYINPQLNNKKTTIPLNQCTSCKLLDGGKFIIGDKNKKKYIFREKEQSAKEWVDNITNLIETYLL